jgi:hypothetical protein
MIFLYTTPSVLIYNSQIIIRLIFVTPKILILGLVKEIKVKRP